MEYLILILVIALGLFLQAFVEVPAEPPHVALSKTFGKFNGTIKEAGYRLFWLRPLWKDFTLIKIETVNKDFKPQTIRVPDRAEVSVSGEITYEPMADRSKSGKKAGALLYNYIHKGGADGVFAILEGMYASRVREYFQKDDEGPNTWEQAIQSGESATFVMMRSLSPRVILGQYEELLTQIERDHGLRTLTLYRCFNRRDAPDRRERDQFGLPEGSTWLEFESVISAILENVDSVSIKDLRIHFNKIETEVVHLRSGDGGVEIDDLGIKITRLNFPEIKVLGEVAKAAEQQAKEKQDKLAEHDEMEFVLQLIDDRAKILARKKGMSYEKAYKIIREQVEVERKKVTKEIKENQISLDENATEGLNSLGKAAPAILAGLSSLNKVSNSGGKK